MKKAIVAALTAALTLVCAGTASAGLDVTALGKFTAIHAPAGNNPLAVFCGFGQTSTCASLGIASVPNESQVRWGNPATSGGNDAKSGLKWLGASGLATSFETPFLIGKLSHANFPIAGNTAIDSTTLTYQLQVSNGTSTIINSSIPVTVNVDETDNAGTCIYPSDPGNPCADKISWSIPTSASVIPGPGGPYVLNILGFRKTGDPSSPLLTEFISQEHSQNDAYLFATIGTSGSGAAANDSYSTVEDKPLVQPAAGGLLANDSNAAAVTSVTVATPAQHGTVSTGPAGGFTYTPAAGYIGTDSFVYLSSTAAGALSLARVDLTVLPDTTPPTVVTAGNRVAEATGPSGAAVSWPAPTASDPDDAAGAVACSPAAGSVFALGTSTVTCSSTDTHGNTGTADFTVTVVDTTAPSITCPASLVVESNAPGGANATPGDATAADSVSAVTVSGPGAGFFPLGTTTLSYSATDAAGNASSCTSTLSVVDTVAPLLVVPADRAVEATSPAGAAVTYAAPTATDLNLGSVSCSPASGSTFAFGATTVSCTATDTSGNSSSGAFTVTVADTHAPVITVPAPITVNASGTGGAPVTYSASAADAVDGSVTVSCSPSSGSTFPVGTTTVNCTATDAHSNTAHASFTVTVRSAGAMLNDLLTLATSLPPGKSLPAKIKVAQANYAAGDIAGTCSMLAAFISEVSAQSGKQLTVAQATDLLTRARAIRTILGC